MEQVDGVAAGLALRFADAGDDEIDAIVTDTLRELAESAGADRAYVTLYHDDGTFENSHEWTASHVVPQMPAIQRLRADDFAYSYDAALRGDVFAAPDLATLPDAASAEQRSFSSFGVQAVIQVPITVSGQGIGLIGLNHFDVVDGWSDELVDTIARVGRVIAVVLHQRRTVRSARRAYEEAARANEVKEQLLTQLGHELRTPLHAILGYAELLELDDRPDDDREALLQIQFHGRHLLTLLEDLVALAHDGSVPAEDVDLAPLAGMVVDAVRHVAVARGIDVTASDRLAGSCVHTEAGRLRQVLYCLVSGAVQSLSPGSSVHIDATPTSDLRVLVRSGSGAPIDDGIVMPLARTLIDGHGTIRTVPDDADSLAIEMLVRAADQVASP